MDFGREAPVYAKELLVHESGQRQAVERLHARIVDTLRVFDLTLGLECEVLCQMPALVIAAQQVQRITVADLQSPKE